MALKLKWKNPNKRATTIDIYRGDTNQVDLTTPMVSLTNGEAEYIDTTALFGKTYYYVWAVNTETDRVVSRPQKIEVTDRRGPGSNVLLHGNEDYGFFGTVASSDFINSSVLYAAAKNKSGIPSGLIYPTWYKYIRHGKVLFVPNATFGDVVWNNLYNAGLVFGTNDNGFADGTVNQLTTFEFNGDTFLIRCINGFPDGLVYDGSATPTPDTMPGSEDNYSEFEDLIYPYIYSQCPVRQRMVTVGNETYDSILPSAYNSNSRDVISVPCREINGNNVIGRGRGYDNRYYSPTRAYLSSVYARTKTNTFVWVPVVELIGRTDEIDLTAL